MRINVRQASCLSVLWRGLSWILHGGQATKDGYPTDGVDPDDNTIQLNGLGEGVVDAQ